MNNSSKYFLKLVFLFFVLLQFLYPVSSIFSLGSYPLNTLESNVGTRAMAAGGTFVSIANDNSAIFHNPSGLAGFKKNTNYIGLQYLTDPLTLGTNYFYGSYVYSLREYGNIGGGLILNRYSDLQSYDVAGDFTGNFNTNELIFAVAHGYKIFPKLYIGEAIKVGYLSYGTFASATSLALDFGLLYEINKKIKYGISFKNIYSTPYTLGMEEETQPLIIKTGPTIAMLKGKGFLSYEAELTPSLYNSESLQVIHHFGFRYDIYKKFITAKIGYDGQNITAGLGTVYKRYQMDLAFSRNPAGFTTSLGLQMSLTGLGSGRDFNPNISPEEFGSDNPINLELDYYYQGMSLYSKALGEHTRGDLKEAKKHFQESLVLFDKTLDLNPDHSLAKEYRERCLTWLKGGVPLQKEEKQLIRIHKKLARQYFGKKRYGSAIYEWRQVLKLDAGDAEAPREIKRIKRIVYKQVMKFYKKGLKYYSKNEKIKALDSLNDALHLDPEHKLSLKWVKKIQNEMNEKERQERERIERLQKAEVLYSRGLSYYGKNSLKLAITSFVACLKLNPIHERAKQYLALARQELKDKKLGMKGLKIAKAHYQKGMGDMKDKDYATAILQFKASLEAYHRYQPSIKQINIARKKLRKRVKPLIREGKSAYRKKEMTRAVQKFELVIAIDPNNAIASDYLSRIKTEVADTIKFNMQEGKTALDTDKYSKAISHFKEVLLLDKNHKEAAKLLAQAQNEVKDKTDVLHEKAMSAYKKQDYPNAIIYWEKLLLIDSAHVLALKYLPRARELKKAKNNKRLISAWIYEGDAHFDNREYVQAIAFYDKVLAVQRKNKKVKKKRKRAKAELKSEKKKNRISKLFLEGIQSYRKKKYLVAIKKWKLVLTLDRKNAMAKKYIKNAKNAKKTAKIKDYIQGKKAFTQGKYASALIFFRRAIKVNPNNDKAQDFLERTQDKMHDEMEDFIKKGKSALRDANYNKAIEFFTLAKKNAIGNSDKAKLGSRIEDNTKARNYYEKGINQMSEGGEGIVESIVLFSKVLEINPFDKKASEKYKEAIGKGSEQADQWLEEAENLYGEEKYKKAGNLFTAVRNIRPDNEDALKGWKKTRKKLFEKANMETKKGDEAMDNNSYSTAISSYKASLAILDDSDVKVKLAKARERLEAKRAKRKRAGVGAGNRKDLAIINKGIALYRQGKYQAAINVWRRVGKSSSAYGKAKGYIARAKLKL